MPFCRSEFMFENDVEMYGAQTLQMAFSEAPTFENDVEMYGAQTQEEGPARQKGLRMM